GQRADEEAHGEADAGEQADAIDPGPAGPRGFLAQAELDREPGGAEDADLLADEEPDGDPAGHTVEELVEAHPVEVQARIGETEERHDQEGAPGMEAVLD